MAALAILEQNQRMVDENNLKFQQGLVNFQSGLNQFSTWTSDEIRQLFGTIPREEEEVIIMPDVFVNGTISSETLSRRKRAVTTAGPECTNLPADKNWATEGKTAPVQNQASCGKIKL
jgi:hypothetical protein